MAIPSIVTKVTSPIYKASGKFCNKFAELKPVKHFMESSIKDPAKTTAWMLLISIISKDAINCGLYTYQSWNNEKIPKDKRKFVALGDLINGLVMVGGQLLAGFVIDKTLVPKIQSRFTGTVKDSNNKEVTAKDSKATSRIFHSDNIRANLYEVLGEKSINPKEVKIDELVEKVAKKTKAPFISGLGIILTTLFTTALIKRTVAPLISTPLAGLVNDKFVKGKEKPKEETIPEESPVAVSARYLNKKV